MQKHLTEEQIAFLNVLPARYGRLMTKYAYRFYDYRPCMLPLAEEAVQETFVRAIACVETLMAHPNPAGWLMLSLKHTLQHQLREQHRYELPADEQQMDSAVNLKQIREAMEHWEQSLLVSELRTAIQDILTADEKQTFTDHFLVGLNTRETAQSEDVSFDTVRGRISRIRKKLKIYWSDLCCLLLLVFYCSRRSM